jgi:penicillin-binding protein 1C
MDTRRARRAARLPALILLTLFVAGCTARFSELSTLPALPPFLVRLTWSVDQYLADYAARYRLRPRPAASPQAVAEAYLQRYQPGPLPRIFQTTHVLDRDGETLAVLYDEGYRTWVPLDRISPHLIHAIIATEDSTFYTNPGIDVRRVAGAFLQNVEQGAVVSGASTITMQLARQIFFNTDERFEQSLERKVFEALLARDLSALYAKDEILEMYLNLVHFGRLAYGAEAAANLYFAKSAADLTLPEATLLAGIPQQPGDYDPFTNLEAVKQRQRVVLDLMVRHGYLHPLEADFIYATPLQLNPNPAARPAEASHFVQFVTAEAQATLGAINVRRSGLTITTTLDLDLQRVAQRIVTTQVAALRPTYDLSNAALVALQPGTADILVMVGSANFTDTAIAGQVNVATRLRQPGSAIKPVLYALAFDDLRISPATVMWDVPATYKVAEDDRYRPVNYDETFHGPITARRALANSYNIPAVKLLDAIGVERMLAGARAMGIQSLNRGTDWYGLSLTLGGGEVTLLDLTTAFHTLANGGEYRVPRAILAADGVASLLGSGAVWPPAPQPAQRVISPQAAFQVTSILSDNEARTPAFGENSALRLSRPAVAKTGTTSDWRDNWTEGYTRYLVAGVWAGNSDGRPMRHVSGVTGAAPIWNAFMEAVLADPALLAALGAPADSTLWEFTPPAGILLAPVTCPSGIACPDEEWFDVRWLARLGDRGPVGDSVTVDSMNTIYVQRQSGAFAIGACSADSGDSRQLLRLPVGLTRGLPELQEPAAGQNKHAALAAPADDEPQRIDEETARKLRDEQRAALEWSAKNTAPLYFGPCDEAEAVVRQVLGDRNVAVRIEGFTDQIAQLDGDDQQPQQVADAGAPFAAPPAQSYIAQGVAHGGSCSGTSVLGTVYNAAGQLVAGVNVVYTDPFGNWSQQETSSAAQGYGSFEFPILVDEPSTLYIAIVDGSGAPLGQAVAVPHKQGGPTDQSCHYVIWSGVN